MDGYWIANNNTFSMEKQIKDICFNIFKLNNYTRLSAWQNKEFSWPKLVGNLYVEPLKSTQKRYNKNIKNVTYGVSPFCLNMPRYHFVISVLTLKNGCFFTSSASFSPYPSLLSGFLLNSCARTKIRNYERYSMIST